MPLLMGAAAKNSPAAAFVRVQKNPGSDTMLIDGNLNSSKRTPIKDG